MTNAGLTDEKHTTGTCPKCGARGAIPIIYGLPQTPQAEPPKRDRYFLAAVV